MKKIILTLIISLLLSCSGKKDNPNPINNNSDCGYHNGKKLYLGPQGGCYYYSSGGNKEYVSRGECSCELN